MTRTDQIVQEMFSIASRHKLRPEEFMMGVAEVVARTAACAELDSPAFSRFTLDQRMDTFVERVRARYPRVLEEIKARKLMQSPVLKP